MWRDPVDYGVDWPIHMPLVSGSVTGNCGRIDQCQALLGHDRMVQPAMRS
jgi:hypothetical protein